MGLRLVKRGKTYYVRGAVRGVSIYQTTGTGDKSLAEAIRIKTEKRLLDESVYGKASVVTFREAVEEYAAAGGSLRFLLDVKAGGEETGLVPHIGATLLSSIDQSTLDKTAREMYPTATPETLNRQVYTPFIAVWNHAFSGEPSMARKWRRPRKPKGTNVVRIVKQRSGNKPVEYERAAQFIAAMSPAPAMLMTFLFYTGMRPIEAFALEPHMVNVKTRWIVLDKTKTGEPRGVPVHEVLAPMLEALGSGERIFLTPRHKPYTEVQEGGGGLKTAINGARRRTGIKDISPYTGRHTVSTGLVVAGVHPHIKDQILGHAADDMSRHYTNVPRAELIAAINTLPVPTLLTDLPWWQDPVAWRHRLAEGDGKRNDLKEKMA